MRGRGSVDLVRGANMWIRAWFQAMVATVLLVAAFAQAAEGASTPDPRVGELLRQAVALEHGEGVPKDVPKAVGLYCEAALQDSAEAYYALGWIYTNGRGVERNDAWAGTFFAVAELLGHHQASSMLRFAQYVGAAPDCLILPEPASAEWDAEQFLTSQPVARRKLITLLMDLAPQYDIDPRLALAIATTESNLNPAAVSPKNAMGVMQLIPETAQRFNVKNPFDPEQNIKGGLAYLRWLLAYFKGDVALAAAGYNAGEGAVDRYRGVPPYRETRGYVERILSFFARRHHRYDGSVVEPSRALAGRSEGV